MNKKIITSIAIAALILGTGAGISFYSASEQEETTEAIVLPETTEKVTEPVTEIPTTEKKQEQIPVIIETTTVEQEEMTPEQETGCVFEDGNPMTTENFVINEDADTYFEGSVFIGDSVMMGFRNYVMGQPQGFLSDPNFLVSGSFSLRMALARVSESSIHPVYQGEQRPVWESIAMMNAKKAFLFFGINDIDMVGIEGTCENYDLVVGKIREASPQTEIFIISTTNVLTGSEKGGLNNENIRKLNSAVKEYCESAGIQYIDIASFLIGEDGGLKPEYCSDAYVHQTSAAYEVWTKVLRWYASGGTYIIPTEPETTESATTEPEITQTDMPSTEATVEQTEMTTVEAVTEPETETPSETEEQETTPASETAAMEESASAAEN